MAKSNRQKNLASNPPEAVVSRRSAKLEAQQRARQRQDMLRWLGAGLLVAFAAVAVLIWATREDDQTGIAGGPETAATVVAGPSLPSSVTVDGTTLGNADAPILVVEYGDYQCPFCTRFARQDMSKLVEEYIDAGYIRFQFHQLPIVGANSDGSLDQEGESFRAAEAAMCAADQGYYWPYHDALYANSLGEFRGSFTPERLKRIAEQTPGIDVPAFSACLDNRTHQQTVVELADAAAAAGITQTPTFVVNGRPVVGPDYDELKVIIEEQIAGP